MKTFLLKSKRLGVHQVLIDDDAFDLVSKHKWTLVGLSPHESRYTMYAQMHYRKENGRRSIMAMHRFLMGNPKGVIDHIDGNGLNNQKSNLRVVNCAVNRLNSRPNKDNKTGQRNIVFTANGKKFQVKIARWIKGKKKGFYAGTFERMQDAMIARDKFLASIDLELNLTYRRQDVKTIPRYCYPCLNASFGIIHHRQIRKESL